MNLKKIFKDLEIRQVEAAKEIGMQPSTFSLVVNGWISLPEKYKEKLEKYIEAKRLERKSA